MEVHNRYAYTSDVMAPGFAVAHQLVMAKFWISIRVVGAVAIGVGVVAFAGPSRGAGVLLVLIGVWVLFVPRMVRWYTARSLVSAPTYGRDIEWTVNSDGVVLTSDGLDSPMPWTSFSQVVDTNEGLLLVRPGTFYWLPTDRFIEQDGHRVSSELAELSGVKFSRH